LIIALFELVPLERVADFDTLVEVWLALFGRSEASVIRGISRQFWEYDLLVSRNRRAILDVARARFPIHFRPLLRILRSLTGAGFLDTDPLCGSHPSAVEGDSDGGDVEVCARHVFSYFAALPTFSQVIPVAACTGTHAMYEKMQERYGGSNSSLGLTYVNLRPIKLPGGSTLPIKTCGKLLSDEDRDFIVVAWEHPHSGWKVVLEMLTDYVNRRRMYSASNQEYHQEVSFARRGASQAIALSLEDTGVEMDPAGDEIIATDALDLVRSVIQNNVSLAKELLDSLAFGDPVVAHTMTEASAPDLVQLTTMIIEEALSRSVAHSQSSTRIPLITSAMGVLSALLEVPRYSDRVWLYIRSTSALFGSDRSVGFASVALAAERTTGHYTMTMALLHLVQQLFVEASTSILQVQMYTVSLQRVKEEVLLRAAKFVHSEIWVEHLAWKYVQFGDRFVIGRRAALFFVDVVAHFPPPGSAQPNGEDRPFAALCEAIGDAFLYKATTSTINPLVSSIANGGAMLKMLQVSRRYADCGKLRGMLIANLMLARLLLNHKQQSSIANKPSLLEQALCTEVTGGGPLGDSKLKVDPIDVVAGYMKQKSIGDNVKLEAMRMLHSLCASLSSSQSSPPTIVGHLSDPEATVASLVGITQHPYDELALRTAVWNFMSLAVDKEPVLARLLVTGQFVLPSELMGKGITADRDQAATARENGSKHQHSAVNVAKSMLGAYKALWEYNPSLLASLLRFMDVVWQHGAEHKTALDPIRKDPSFWAQLADIVGSKLGDVPNYTVRTYVSVDGIRRADLHQSVSNYAYRAAAKSFALHLIALDVGISLQQAPSAGKQPVASSTKPLGFTKVEPLFRSNFPLTDLVLEAAASSYDPGLHSGFLEYVKAEFPTLTMQQLEVQNPLTERELGDEFTFSTATLRMRLLLLRTEGGIGRLVDDADKRLRSINLNLSLAHAQTAMGEAWQFFLREVVPFVRRDAVARPIVLSISASLSSNLAHEARTGDVMATMHGTRLSLLLSLLEVAWFSTADSAPELKSFITLVDNVHGIILNEPHPPSKSILGNVTVPFHRTVLQIIYFCAKHCRNLAARPKTLGAEHRLTIGTMVDATLNFTIDGLRVVFEAATTRADVELDRDQELLVAVFEQCTRPDINPSSNFWLTRCIETDVIKGSLRLFACADLVGLSDRNLLLSRKHTLYVPHILTFHMALARVPAAAEKLASEGLLNAYSDNSISEAISAGLIDVVLPELPGERSPAHRAYCSMLAIVAVVIGGLGRHNHYFDIEISGFVQLYGDQIMRALSWTIDDSITLPLVEEIEQVVNVFAAMAESAPKSAKPDLTIAKLLRTFNACALLLLQQFNYALTHPHHLASLLEPVAPDERAQVEKSAGEQDVLKRPLTVKLIDRVFVLSSVILSALISISRAESVLIGPQDDWPVQSALLIPVRLFICLGG
jgi:nuclear pore complex protein Nup188